ncbi:unnamed protein product, partial [Amoebophrya sp. A120]
SPSSILVSPHSKNLHAGRSGSSSSGLNRTTSSGLQQHGHQQHTNSNSLYYDQDVNTRNLNSGSGGGVVPGKTNENLKLKNKPQRTTYSPAPRGTSGGQQQQQLHGRLNAVSTSRNKIINSSVLSTTSTGSTISVNPGGAAAPGEQTSSNKKHKRTAVNPSVLMSSIGTVNEEEDLDDVDPILKQMNVLSVREEEEEEEEENYIKLQGNQHPGTSATMGKNESIFDHDHPEMENKDEVLDEPPPPTSAGAVFNTLLNSTITNSSNTTTTHESSFGNVSSDRSSAGVAGSRGVSAAQMIPTSSSTWSKTSLSDVGATNNIMQSHQPGGGCTTSSTSMTKAANQEYDKITEQYVALRLEPYQKILHINCKYVWVGQKARFVMLGQHESQVCHVRYPSAPSGYCHAETQFAMQNGQRLATQKLVVLRCDWRRPHDCRARITSSFQTPTYLQVIIQVLKQKEKTLYDQVQYQM